jgi:O-antigen/teichoic acid export membrane protein
VSFGLPLTAGYALGFILNTPDRLSIENVLGPIAACKQPTSSASITRAVAIPACVYPLATGPQIVRVLLWPDFSADAQQITSWVVLTSFMFGSRNHPFNHAFHLSKNPMLLMLSAGPTALPNIALNVVMLPRIGLAGVIRVIVTFYTVVLMISIALGLGFSFDFPFGVGPRILIASAAMDAAMDGPDYPRIWSGFIAAVFSGIAIYGVACVAVNIASARDWIDVENLERGRRYG